LYQLFGTVQYLVHLVKTKVEVSSSISSVCVGGCRGALKMSTIVPHGTVEDSPPTIASNLNPEQELAATQQTSTPSVPVVLVDATGVVGGEENAEQGLASALANDVHPYSDDEKAMISRAKRSVNGFFVNPHKLLVSTWYRRPSKVPSSFPTPT
jgi:hypothetical protein